jgi:phosphotriesterase-related protein
MDPSRREFVSLMAALAVPNSGAVQTVRGPVPIANLGVTLTHEHVMVDFVGADQVSPARYDREQVYRAALPKLIEVKQRGCRTMLECTPAWLGRDVALLESLSQSSGLNLITNTGFYGAAKDKYLPKSVYEQPAEKLAEIWIREAKQGIDGTRIRPGFMKLGVDDGPLSDVDRKLIQAGAICHKATGLRMHVHTGPAVPAMQIIEELKRQKVSPSAYVWVHAQAEKDRGAHLAAAKAGAWVSLDGISRDSLDEHVAAVEALASAGYLGQVLVSQDSGWYHVGEPNGGDFHGYTFLFDSFLPGLRQKAGFTEAQIRMLMVDNPARVLAPA